ncbi:unnamed protein product, partial [Ectocarpus sp. 8 AP-2014]
RHRPDASHHSRGLPFRDVWAHLLYVCTVFFLCWCGGYSLLGLALLTLLCACTPWFLLDFFCVVWGIVGDVCFRGSCDCCCPSAFSCFFFRWLVLVGERVACLGDAG